MDISIVDKKCSSIPSNVLKHYKTLEILQSDVPNVQISKYNKYNTAKQSTPQISKTIQQNTKYCFSFSPFAANKQLVAD